REINVAAEGALSVARTIPARVKNQGESYPCGLALSADGATAFVCLSCNNCLAVVDLGAGRVTGSIPVGLAPFDVVLSPDGQAAYVSDWGGRRATKQD